ncbi:hypothetical protein [uncultured Litoreibacter sp.]|uniref:hypothetical protein n=1 Tax=uncultured Litoreibacter sp. TaxID=1392394 RepID=UPI0026035017|nr:hypothetical protein [uncultured Litoreibacter sp.]
MTYFLRQQSGVLCTVIIIAISALTASPMTVLALTKPSEPQMILAKASIPEDVPETAVFRGGPDGGYYVTLVLSPLVLADGRQLPAYELGVFHGFSGDVEYQGAAHYVPPREVDADGTVRYVSAPSVEDILKSAYYSFGALEFPVAGSSRPGKIIPLPLSEE